MIDMSISQDNDKIVSALIELEKQFIDLQNTVSELLSKPVAPASASVEPEPPVDATEKE